AAASKPHWESRNTTGILPSIPNISTGWDSRPWHGFRQTVVYGKSVESFRKICEDFKTFADQSGVKRVALAPLNEWGEGSYAEPNVEFGFGMYEALRETLCKEPEGGWPTNFAPEELGLGPYDLPKE
ncbi:MAG: glycoside hydrolase family 99-like domain-containing protein, partial [Thermoguttaceae bacterium]|nr:glycoside hydrolase family 99-like domain-containing protein [Thermoguttaceae bacterium]